MRIGDGAKTIAAHAGVSEVSGRFLGVVERIERMANASGDIHGGKAALDAEVAVLRTTGEQLTAYLEKIDPQTAGAITAKLSKIDSVIADA
ncbi:MAG: hypothetical protein WCH83_15025, partial [Alphaproteobacteria bacterium]